MSELLVLSPRIYNKNFKWGILPRNKIDTVTMQPVRNALRGESVSITMEVAHANIVGSPDVTHLLPIALNVPPTHQASANNYEKGRDVRMCAGRVGCVVASDSVLFKLEKPLPQLPSVKLHVDGETYYINRGSLTHRDVLDNIDANSMAEWIYNNASGSEEWKDKSTDPTNRGMYDDPTLVDYTAASVPLYAWSRKLYPAGIYTFGQNVEQHNQPKAQDVFTTWADQSAGYAWAHLSDWQDYGLADAVEMWPVDLYTKGNINATKIALRNRNVPISASVIKIDDYNYQVNYSIPVRYEYMASSQYYDSYLGIRVYRDLDNYCFLDRVSKITIELQAQQIDDDTQDISYSIDDSDKLTTEVLNEHPLSFERNELITVGAKWGDRLWTERMSLYLLAKFREGKYIVECEVPAIWALRNNVHINTEMVVQLQDTTFIERDVDVCIFQVKNITKRVQNNNFTYTLSLMEV